MLKLKNNFRNNRKGDISCQRYHKEIDNEKHLLERSNQLDVYTESIKLRVMKKSLV